MKGLFIPGITVEMFRNGCLEGIEALMVEGEIYDIDYDFKEREPCEDTISRQAALDAVFNNAESPNKAYKAIRILPSAQPELCEDAISRKQIKEKLQYVIDHGFAAADGYHPVSAERVLGYIIKMSSVAPKQRWIPFALRPATDEEKEENPGLNYYLDGKLPDDGQKILITVRLPGHEEVQVDEFYSDDGGSYLGGGYEIGTEAVAWMPMPEKYSGE